LRSRQTKLQTPAECRLRLRNALFNDDGKDKNCVKDFEAFMTYSKEDLDLKFTFHTGKQIQKKNAQLLVMRIPLPSNPV